MTRRDWITMVIGVLAIGGTFLAVHLRADVPTWACLIWGAILTVGALGSMAVTIIEEDAKRNQ